MLNSELTILEGLQPAELAPEPAKPTTSKGRITRPRRGDKGISYLRDDSGMYELVMWQDSTLHFVSRAAGKFSHSTTAGTHPPAKWLEGFAQGGALALPSGVSEYGTIDGLAEGARGHIHRYFDCPARFESVAVLFVMLTWVSDRFHAVPYLRFLGIAGTGKSRGSDVIGSLCYRRLSIAGGHVRAHVSHDRDGWGHIGD